MHLVFHPSVASEISASYHWYQEQAEGLGDDFLTELESSYDAICELPDTWPKFKQYFRRFLLSKFPFSVIYRPDGDILYVIAVMHNSRKPDYWAGRT
ncbi:MAG: type II toxin-antitoxin system RelE/ParE family toxin [Ectothiorhodospiraceae bacterium]|nr:type II toxin-antitoxin system RelE/ParE family toxin [Ectothiorhodospiraceae bacterium]